MGIGRKRPLTEARRVLAVELMVSGHKPGAIAERLGVSDRAVRRYFEEPETRAQLTAALDERLHELARLTMAAAPGALGVLHSVAHSIDSPASARVAAAGKMLDLAPRLVEAHELQERIAALELALPRREGEQ